MRKLNTCQASQLLNVAQALPLFSNNEYEDLAKFMAALPSQQPRLLLTTAAEPAAEPEPEPEPEDEDDAATWFDCPLNNYDLWRLVVRYTSRFTALWHR